MCQYMEVVGCWVRKAGFCKGGEGGGGGELLSLSMSSFSDNFCCKILETIANFFFKFFPYPAKHRIPISFSFTFLSNCYSMYMYRAQQDSKDTFKVHSKTVALQNIITYCNKYYCNKKKKKNLKKYKTKQKFQKNNCWCIKLATVHQWWYTNLARKNLSSYYYMYVSQIQS